MILLPAGNASAWTGPTGNNTYLLPGDVPTLIDAGVGNPEHLDALSRALDGAPLARVLLTHGHVDHVGGRAGARRALAGRRRQAVRRGRASARRRRSDRCRRRGVVRVLHTPGHSPDHCCFVRGGDVFCGDLARIGGTVVIPASRGGDLAVYLDSLRRVRDLQPARLLPAHGPIIDDPAGADRRVHRTSRARAKRRSSTCCRPVRRRRRTIVARVYERAARSTARRRRRHRAGALDQAARRRAG